jgi:DNA adenine methylase
VAKVNAPLRAPFPAFGGKSKVASIVWQGLGHKVPNYVEPCCFSAAVLLDRPGGAGKIETINDLHGAVPNFWRGVKHDPEAVAKWCDWPVSELDLNARHVWLVQRFREIREQLVTDPDFFDAQAAGWWVYGACSWIGGGWCKDNGSSHSEIPGRKLPNITSNQPRPKRPQLCDGPSGVHLPSLGNDRGLRGVSAPPALEWFRALQERLRNVRIACGDFERVLGDSVLGKGNNVGGRRPCAVFLDPPYSHDHRDKAIYAEESATVAERARNWAIEHGDDPELRICLAGYFDEHQAYMPANWTVHRWTGGRGYAAKDNTNREQETLWFSPHCLPLEKRQRELFEVAQ